MYVPPLPIKPTEIIGGCIAIWRDIWPNPEKTINTIESVTSKEISGIKFVPAFEFGPKGLADGRRTNYDLGLTNSSRINEELRQINNKFMDLTLGAALYYSEKFASGLPFYFEEGFNVLKYQTGEEYKAHFDGPTSSHRSFSPILYLNDNYTGGELEFVHHNIKLKPTAGMFAMFPANFSYTHIAHPVQTGTKYAIVTWLHDQPSQES